MRLRFEAFVRLRNMFDYINTLRSIHLTCDSPCSFDALTRPCRRTSLTRFRPNSLNGMPAAFCGPSYGVRTIAHTSI